MGNHRRLTGWRRECPVSVQYKSRILARNVRSDLCVNTTLHGCTKFKFRYCSVVDYKSLSPLERVLDGVGIGDPISNPLNKVYGEDWVIMDYVPGSSQVQITMLSSDLRGRLDEDELGTPIDDLPIFDDINSIADFDIVVFQMGPRSSPDVAVYMYPNYPTEQPGNPVYYICGIGEGFALVTPWVGPGLPYPAGMFGPVNAAEYMSLTRDYYDIPLQSIGLRLVDGLSLFHLLAIILMILGNLVVVGDKLGGKK
jgi:hypothetical protein